MDKKDGGQAFPHGDPTNGGDIGMTLRDYFAAKAMLGFIAEPPWRPDAESCSLKIAEGLGATSQEVFAIAAYRMADAMLAERAKEQP